MVAVVVTVVLVVIVEVGVVVVVVVAVVVVVVVVLVLVLVLVVLVVVALAKVVPGRVNRKKQSTHIKSRKRQRFNDHRPCQSLKLQAIIGFVGVCRAG